MVKVVKIMRVIKDWSLFVKRGLVPKRGGL